MMAPARHHLDEAERRSVKPRAETNPVRVVSAIGKEVSQ